MAKYNKETVDKICQCIRDGDSQKLACQKVGLGETTFYQWVKDHPEFEKSIKKAKDEFQATIVGKLETTLWKRAMGYEVTETETEYISDSNGRPKIKSQRTKVKHIQPDTGALIFALTNVAPEKWVNKQKVETQEVKRGDEKERGYCFEDLPDDVLFDLADKMQAAEYERTKRRKDGEKEGDKTASGE